jgi:hypothetical protein
MSNRWHCPIMMMIVVSSPSQPDHLELGYWIWRISLYNCLDILCPRLVTDYCHGGFQKPFYVSKSHSTLTHSDVWVPSIIIGWFSYIKGDQSTILISLPNTPEGPSPHFSFTNKGFVHFWHVTQVHGMSGYVVLANSFLLVMTHTFISLLISHFPF